MLGMHCALIKRRMPIELEIHILDCTIKKNSSGIKNDVPPRIFLKEI